LLQLRFAAVSPRVPNPWCPTPAALDPNDELSVCNDCYQAACSALKFIRLAFPDTFHFRRMLDIIKRYHHLSKAKHEAATAIKKKFKIYNSKLIDF
jgi:hypothetical protein